MNSFDETYTIAIIDKFVTIANLNIKDFLAYTFEIDQAITRLN